MKNTKIIDTNVILRYLLEDDEKFFTMSKEIFDKALQKEIEVLIKEWLSQKLFMS